MGDDRPPYHNQAGRAGSGADGDLRAGSPFKARISASGPALRMARPASGGIAGSLSAQSSAQRSSRRSPKTPLHIKHYNKIKGKMSTTNYNVAHYSLIFVSCTSQQRLSNHAIALFNTFVKNKRLKYRRGCKGTPSVSKIAVIRIHYSCLRARTTSPISPSMQIDRSVIASGHAASPQLTQA